MSIETVDLTSHPSSAEEGEAPTAYDSLAILKSDECVQEIEKDE